MPGNTDMYKGRAAWRTVLKSHLVADFTSLRQ